MEVIAEAFFQYLRTEKAASENTLYSYQHDMAQYFSFLTSIGLSDPSAVSGDIAKTYYQHLVSTGKADSTIARNLATLRSFYRYWIYTGHCRTNPFLTIAHEKQTKKLPLVLSGKEVELLLKQPDPNDPLGIRDRAMLEMLYASGMKVSELINLNVDDIHFQLAFVRCAGEGKTPERIVPLYPIALQAAALYMENVRPLFAGGDRSEAALFLNHTGGRLTRQGFWKIIKKYAESAGIQKNITPQILRHSFATHLLENGADLKSIQQMLGHSDISTTAVYAQLVKSKLNNIYNKYHPRS